MLEDIRLAFQGIWSHKLRSALTMLGIIIGIGSIIAIVSTIKGTNEQIKKNLVGAGNNAVNIQLYQGDWTLDLSYQEVPDGIPEISDQVLGEIQALDEVESAALYHRRNEYDAVYAGSQKLASCNIFGIDSNYLDAYGFQITKGRGFSEKDFNRFSYANQKFCHGRLGFSLPCTSRQICLALHIFIQLFILFHVHRHLWIWNLNSILIQFHFNFFQQSPSGRPVLFVLHPGTDT